MKKYQRYIFTMLMTLLGCVSILFPYEKQSDGVLFHIIQQKPSDVQLMKVQICTDEIIRVIASPSSSFSPRQSLMVNKTIWQEIPWTVKENGAMVEISTSKLMVKVNAQTGALSFFDAKGKLLLQETTIGGKNITQAEVMNEQTFHVQQIFQSPAEESFYGLGAHQNGIWNYKGHDLDLWQYNIVDVVPYLVSSKNYGLLWDNNSRTKFGDIRDYEPLSSLLLYNKEGKKGGLTVEYFKDSNCSDLLTTQTEDKIEHDFVDQPGIYPEGFNTNNGSIRWSGAIAGSETGNFKFKLHSSGYAKLWVNGKLVVDSWRQNWLPWTHLQKLEMKPGTKYQFKLEWKPVGGNIGMKYLTPDKNEKSNTISLYSEVADQIDYYFVHGENLDQVVQGYRDLTGKAPMMPKWAMGFWQCRERYKSSEEILSTVKQFREKQIPLDNIVQDWFYWKEDQWGSHEFDSTRYPDPEGLVKELHNSLHARIMISIWPKFYVGTKNYDAFNEKGWLYNHAIETKQKDWVGPGYVSTFFDPFNDSARDLYWKQVNEKLFSKGFDAWWADATEPDLGSNPSNIERLLRMHPNALGTAARNENAFSLMLTKGLYENQRKTNNDQRVFILTRSAFGGQQRNASATWSGDVASRWEDLQNQIPAGLNFALSGIPYWTTDIGGFAVETRYEHPNAADLEEWRELQTRWFQFGAFTPLFRSHGQFPLREMFNIAPEDHPAFQSMLQYDKLRYRLMPYIYSLTGKVTQNNYTIMRPLVMDFANDKKATVVSNQFMFGPSLLVNPVTEYKAHNRSVYLPEGSGWYDLKSGKYIAGGKTIKADAPYTEIPIYVKAGSIIPFGPDIQYTEEKSAETLKIYVYTGSDGSFSLYEDENVNYNYEKGKFSVIPLSYNEKNRTLTIGNRQGDFAGMLSVRTFEIVWIGKKKPVALDFTVNPDSVIVYNGNAQIVTLK